MAEKKKKKTLGKKRKMRILGVGPRKQKKYAKAGRYDPITGLRR